MNHRRIWREWRGHEAVARAAGVRVATVVLLASLAARGQAPGVPGAPAPATAAAAADSAASRAGPFWQRLESVIERHLGRPYVWGASGLRSFDCSGFVWRVMTDNGVMIKRTTARKFSLMLPEVPDSAKWDGGNLVFFDHFKHCGIVCDSTGFFHAAVHKGTCRAPFTRLWSKKICGYRAMPVPETRP